MTLELKNTPTLKDYQEKKQIKNMEKIIILFLNFKS